MTKHSSSLAARPAVQSLVASKIREVANAGIGREDVAAFWFGEPDEVTPEFIRRAAAASLEAGETFYTHNLGIPELRETIAAYVTRLRRPTGADEIAVTNSGMSALMLLTQALVGPGDRVVVVTPVWPNLQEIPKILGAEVVKVPLAFDASGWRLDLDHLINALTPGTRAVYINSPNNPTGWTIDTAALRTILEHCRRHGIWILADDAYERLYYGAKAGTPAPSFLDIAAPEDRLVSANTFSKSWLMTGWRLGWILAPRTTLTDIGKLIEYNTCCAPVFVQRAGMVAIREGEPIIAHTLERYRGARDFLLPRLQALPGVEAASPPGAMYAFFRVRGVTDSLEFCKRLVAEQGLGLAPGAAFGPEGEGFVRWCFAAAEERLADGIARFERAIRRREAA
ncbi:MAG: pyridoxal phosphate-dependent aminotransferase [Betaproteobacteria bacterium]|jgi:aspartate/methionine/tyrosine aminotransferase|nr:pyridoxal phosphate-dependent aminotransferase [Betaproteobacteria bacterium]